MRSRLYSKKKDHKKEGARILVERKGADVAAAMCLIGLK